MLRYIALILSIVLQLVAVVIALRLTKVTKYKISWILISGGFVFMAFRYLIDLFQYMNRPALEELAVLNDWISVLISIFIASGVIIIPEIFNYMRRAEHARKIAEKNVLNAIIETEERERKRFAKDLHDGLGPLLSTVKMSVSALMKTEKDEKNLEIIKNTDHIINEAIKSIKEISNNLSPHVLTNFGLASAVKNFTDKINETKVMEIDFNSNIHNLRYQTNIEVVLYRTICELVNNSLQHSNATNIKIDLTSSDSIIDLIYEDNGKGFDVNKVLHENTRGTGLRNMVSRIESVNGTYKFENKLKTGFKASFSIHIGRRHDKA
jgi:signal transduction histidine kinase